MGKIEHTSASSSAIRHISKLKERKRTFLSILPETHLGEEPSGSLMLTLHFSTE
jgi:hypothetical protein